jgi:8-oxo-dGTP pyrophosphatase MutT (NUDIX family)
MSPVRPDLIEAWIFRVPADGSPEYLLIRRAEDRIFPGLWQPVTGGLRAGETVPTAALREVEEETGFAGDDIEAFFDLDQVGSFYAEDLDAIVNSVIFAAQVSAGAQPRLSKEHTACEWVGHEEAVRRSVWPPYRASVDLIERIVVDPSLAHWFELDRSGRRVARLPHTGGTHSR